MKKSLIKKTSLFYLIFAILISMNFPAMDWASVGLILKLKTHNGSIVIGECVKDSGGYLTLKNKYGTFAIQKNKIKEIIRINKEKTDIKKHIKLKTADNSKKTSSNINSASGRLVNPEFYLGIYLNYPFVISKLSDSISERPGTMLQLFRPLGKFNLIVGIGYLNYNYLNASDRLYQIDFLIGIERQLLKSGSWRGFVFTSLGASLVYLDTASMELNSRGVLFQMQLGIACTYILDRLWQVQLRLPFTSIFEKTVNLSTINLQLGVLFGF